MAYNKFTLTKVKKQFRLTTDSTQSLFQEVNPVEISAFLTSVLAQFTPFALAINTEKARSELIVTPILVELHKLLHGNMSFFSGITFNVDLKQHLVGVCDFIISQSAEQYALTAPVITIVEAKNDNIAKGLGQCIATMIATQIFNEQENSPREVIYGAITTGTTWKFLKLIGQTVYIDKDEYYLNDLGKIMGILVYIVNH